MTDERREFMEEFASKLDPETLSNFAEAAERFTEFFDAFAEQVKIAYKMGYVAGYEAGKRK